MPSPPPPMLARLAEELPAGPGWLYEPKWDGFRATVVRAGSGVRIHSRNGHPLHEVFPEVATALVGALPDRCTVDGELICPVVDGGLSFEALLGRMSRRRGGEPAGLMVFDLLELDGEDNMCLPFADRRRRLEASVTEGGRIAITPQSDDPAVARAWLEDCDVQGVEGVVAKRAADLYRPGHRGWVKVKRRRTVDCVVGGFRGARLILGLHDEHGLLHHVGETVPLPPMVWVGVEATLAAARGPAFTGRPPGVGRWEGDRYEEWTECLPRAVCEVAYTQLDGGRFRHPVRFVRWRPDRGPSSCLRDQLLRPDRSRRHV